MSGKRGPRPPALIADQQAPVWTRLYSDGTPPKAACDELRQVLDALKVERLVVGHTVQRRVSSACDERVWRIDVGMAAHYGGSVAVLEIDAKGVRPLSP